MIKFDIVIKKIWFDSSANGQVIVKCLDVVQICLCLLRVFDSLLS